MKTPLFSPPPRVLLYALIGWLTGVGCAAPLALCMGLSAPWWLIPAVCAGVVLVYSALDCVPKLRGLVYPLLLIAMMLTLLPYVMDLSALCAALTLAVNGQPLALVMYSRPIAALLAILFAVVGISLARSEQACLPLAFLLVTLLLCVSFLGAGMDALTLLPLLAALLLASDAPGTSAPRIVLWAGVVLALTVALLPLGGQTVPPLADFAQRVRQTINDYLFFTDARTAFSLSATGWQPLGANRLGGPANPPDDPVMQVRTSGRTLLRGAIRNTYTGAAWADTLPARRYLYVNPRFAALRRDLFDLARPEKAIRQTLPDAEAITVLMLADAASTLYLTQRFQSPSGADIVPYFSPASEVFATRALAQGDSYTFTGQRLTADSADVRAAVLAAAGRDDPYWATVCASYLDVPMGVEQGVYALAQALTADATTPFDQAVALCQHLRSAYTYTKEQTVPPTSRDFVSWFLLTEQRGYCTSFASALAIMARTLGLPARYIEGYAAEPQDGVAHVTQQNAHAWVEIYFSGFGWLTFDPTPGENGTPNTPDTPPQSSPAPSGNPPSPTPTPTLTPPPTPTPTPTPTPAPDDGGMPTPTPTPVLTPSPTPTPTAPPMPTPTPPAPPPEDDSTPPNERLALLVLLLLALLAVLRMALVAPARVASRQRKDADKLLIWYRAVEQALTCMGIAPVPGEAPATYLWRAQTQLEQPGTLDALGEALCVARYSAHKLSTQQLADARSAYAALLRQMRLTQRLRLYGTRFVHGVKLGA